ncbi:MAG: 2-C-methyl-D-erythritol 4-phosphate cytidylyltransferase, partial [Candidatus Puniceispirillum sp.]
MIVAAGNGTRAASTDIASTLPKQFWQLGEKPVFRHALDHANQHPRVGQIILVVSSSFIEMTKNFTADLGDKVQIISGGVTRQDSVRAGLTALNSLPDAERSRYVAIHDAARPLIPDGLIESMLEALDAAPVSVAGIIPVLTLADSLKSRQ